MVALPDPYAYHETFNYQSPLTTIGGRLLMIGSLLHDTFHADRLIE